MTFSAFSFVFITVVFACFYLLRKEARLFVLTAASMIYVFCLGVGAGIMVLTTSVFVYAVAILISHLLNNRKIKAAKLALTISVIVLVASLLLCKDAALLNYSLFGGNNKFLAHIVLMVGFSFYLFQGIGYCVDVYTGRTVAEKNPLYILLYMTWIPRFVSGPIEREGAFVAQAKKLSEVNLWDSDRWAVFGTHLVYGAFLKLVIADRVGVYVDRVFADLSSFGSVDLILASLGYTMQIYCDFAGYSLVAIGFSKLFGIDLSDNFRMPYCAQNITEFWRRWHMSLSSWLRDYVYIPLGGNRKGFVRQLVNVLIVFVLCGMWHGSGVKFLIWGILHGLYSVADHILAKKGVKILRSGWTGRIVTFCAVSFAWIFFRVDRMSDAIHFLMGIIRNPFGASGLMTELNGGMTAAVEILIAIVSCILVLLLDGIAYHYQATIPELIVKKGPWVKCLFIFGVLLLVLVFGRFGPLYETTRFIYMQF